MVLKTCLKTCLGMLVSVGLWAQIVTPAPGGGGSGAAPSSNPAPPVVSANGTAAISSNSSANNYGGILTFGTVTGSSTTTITATWQTPWAVKPVCAVFGANSSSGDLFFNLQPYYDYANSSATTALFTTTASNWTTGMAISYKCRQPTSAPPTVAINSGVVSINAVSDKYQGLFTFGAVTGASTTVTLTAPSVFNAKPSCQFFGVDSVAAGFLWNNGNYFDYVNSSTALVKWHSGGGGFAGLSNTSYAYFCEDGAEFLPTLSGAGSGAAVTAGSNLSHGIITTGTGVGAADIVLGFAALGSGIPACQFDGVGSEASADNWHNTAGFYVSGSSTPVSIHLSVPFASSGVGISYSCTVSAGQNGPGSVGAQGAAQVAGVTAGSFATGGSTAAHNGSYAIAATDWGLILTTNTAAAWTVAACGSAGFPANWSATLNNVGSGALALTATTSTFYGGNPANISGSVLTVPANTGAQISCGGTNYQVVNGPSGIPILTFANLGTPIDSTDAYCQDCTVTSAVDDTCAASGSGASAERINGAWKCRI